VRPRRASAGETDALAAIHASAFASPWSARDLAALLGGVGAFALVSEVQGKAAGFILCRLAADEGEILTLATHPDFRRKGVARGLLQAAVAQGRAAGAASLFLEVAADNAPAIGLYRREGFAASGRRRGYYARPGARPVDALVLRLALNR
jgi:ribosomal-protein-alanine N-acetyltransferase